MTRTKCAELGSVSSGTMRNEDLIPAFYDALRELGGKCGTKYQKLLNLKNGVPRSYWASDDADYDLEALFEALDEHAAPYCRFGAHDGDGADYGFWVSWDSLEDDARAGTVLKVDAGDEWPDPLPEGTEYVLEVTDHGNGTLYTTDGTELWSVV